MRNRGYLYILGFIVVFSFSGTPALSQDQVAAFSKAGECELRVEYNEKQQTLRLRAHHPKYKGCNVDKDSMMSVLGEAFSKDDWQKPGVNYSSLSLGRLINYPWLSQYLAAAAYQDRGWNSKKGKPASMDINKYVSQLLRKEELLEQIEPVFEKCGYRVAGVTVEKVLVGGFRDVPLYTREMHPGKVPYDAQAWFRLERK